MKKLTLLFLFSALISSVSAQKSSDVIDGYQACQYTPKDGSRPMPYRLYTPVQKKGEKYPLVFFLHGAGKAQGDDNISQMNSAGPKSLASKAVQDRYPCWVVLPQCPKTDLWFTPKLPAGYEHLADQLLGGEFRGSAERRIQFRELSGDSLAFFYLDTEHLTKATTTLIELIQYMIANYPVDPDRVYVMGGSLGGYGTWAVAMHIPELLAAIAPLQGSGDPNNVEPLRELPIWIAHGDADTTIPPSASRQMYAALRKAGNKNVHYVEYPGIVHGKLVTTVFSDDKNGDGIPEILDWLFQQKRKH